MKTLVKKVDYLDSNLAAAQCGSNYVAIEKSFVKDLKQQADVVKVILKTKNAWGKTIQQTYYCRKFY